MQAKRTDRRTKPRPRSTTFLGPRRAVLVIVHPGSACGSADFNYGSQATAENYRQVLMREWREWRGDVIIIDGALNEELAGYPQLKEALDDLLVRSSSAGAFAVRVSGDDPKQDRAITSVLRRWKRPKDTTQFLVTGAWHYAGGEGCVGSVCHTIRALGYHGTISPAALTGDDGALVEH